VTLIAVAATHCHPEAYDRAYHDLISRATNPDPDDEEIAVFITSAKSLTDDRRGGVRGY
jgi:hypothetical protein